MWAQYTNTPGTAGGRDRMLAVKRRRKKRKKNDSNNNGQLQIANANSGSAQKLSGPYNIAILHSMSNTLTRLNVYINTDCR